MLCVCSKVLNDLFPVLAELAFSGDGGVLQAEAKEKWGFAPTPGFYKIGPFTVEIAVCDEMIYLKGIPPILSESSLRQHLTDKNRDLPLKIVSQPPQESR